MVASEMTRVLQAAGFDGTHGRAAAGLTVTQQSALLKQTHRNMYVPADMMI